MWLDKLKEIIKLMKLQEKDVAAVAGMSASGMHDALKTGSIKFHCMIKILNYYNINYYELIEEEFSTVSEKINNYETTYKGNTEITKIIKALKESYEDRIKKSEEYNVHLRGQVLFLQQIISKNIGLEGSVSHTG